ncbi:oocyte zinc finger protein XlCOF6-like [Chelmon rostratus]|uniref:oocyte zinc finger protein XlCOF6-like n=1 Tax=Chelmon rostratus TaxID=109905 RepID=UPI001BECE11E|nr:oocyte zinc finger protein XlCOF6-like [Chelmon rostratus]
MHVMSSRGQTSSFRHLLCSKTHEEDERETITRLFYNLPRGERKLSISEYYEKLKKFVKLLRSMISLKTIESQISAVLESLVKAAVAELSTLVDQCSANAMAAQHGCAQAPVTPVKNKEEESEAAPPEGRQQFNTNITSQFASLMETWAKGAVEKILIMLKVSMSEAEDDPASEGGQRAGLSDGTKQTRVKPKAGCVAASKKKSASRRPRQKRKKTDRGLESVIRKENDHMYCREEQHTEEPAAAAADSETKPADAAARESNSGSPSEPKAALTEPLSELASDVSGEDDTQEVTDTSSTTQKIKKKPTGPFHCPSCNKSFALKCLMDRHFLTHSKPHFCSECGKRFAGLRGLIAHSRRHTGEKLHKCSDCGTEFAYKSTFDRHMRQHSLEKPSTHTCTLCENEFTGLLAFQRHRCCALQKTFVCSLCPETFESRQSLADHENQHSGDRDFVCEMCGEGFFSSSSLATHRVTHMQKENYCDVVSLGCSDLSILKNHTSKQAGEKLFSCEVCGKGCSHQSALKHHMLTHTGERPYICETCGKRCSHASALQNHMRIHTGKKPGQQPVCNTCGKKFRRTINLKYHMSIHTGEKPYTCDQCDKKFSNPSNLKLHMRVHSGEKMYGCNICGRRFTHSSSLKLHRRFHTGERPYQCIVCGEGFRYNGEFKKHQTSHLPDGDGLSEKTAMKI